MFEPDGRNVLQSAGHFIVGIFRFLGYAVLVVSLAPLFLFMFFFQTARIQRESISIWNAAPINAIRLDFNNPGLTTQDLVAFATTSKQGHHDPKSPAYFKTFPAGLTTMEGQQQDAAYLWHELPVSHYDPRWITFGAWNMGPDKDWDWSDGEMLIRAKATANYRAYVSAVATIGRIKAYVLGRQYAYDLTDDLLAGGDVYLKPDILGTVLVGNHTPMNQYDLEAMRPRFAQFAQSYNSLFKGKLPVVVLHLQDLRRESIQAMADAVKAQSPNWATHHWGFAGHAAPGPFITGITLGPAFDRQQGRPEWSLLDFFVWSTPSASAGAGEAQDTLMDLNSISFWRPLLQAEGLGDDLSLSQVEQILAYQKKLTTDAVRVCRREGHLFYFSHDNSFNPWIAEYEHYDPHHFLER